MEPTNSGLLRKAGVATTLVDAGLAFARGRVGSGILLLIAAAASTRVPGLGVLASVGLRVYRRLSAPGRTA